MSVGRLLFEERDSVTSGRYKYIYPALSEKEELYDLWLDPSEQRSLRLARSPESEAVRSQLIAAFSEERADADALRARIDLPDPAKGPIDHDTLEALRAIGYAR